MTAGDGKAQHHKGCPPHGQAQLLLPWTQATLVQRLFPPPRTPPPSTSPTSQTQRSSSRQAPASSTFTSVCKQSSMSSHPGKIHCPSEHQTQGARRRLQHRGLQWGRCRGSERSQRWRYSNLSDSLQLSRKVGLWRRPRGSVTAAAGSRAAQAAAATGGQRNTLCHCSPGPLGGRWLRTALLGATARSTVPSTTAIFETTDCRSGSGQGRYSGRGHRYGASTTPASL